MNSHPTKLLSGHTLASNLLLGMYLLWPAASAVLAGGSPLCPTHGPRTVAQASDCSERHAAELRRAARRGDLEAVLVHLGAGADPNAPDEDGDTPLHWTFLGKHASSGAEIARTLLEAGANPISRGSYRSTPLHLACKRGDSGAVRVLLDAGADPAVPDKDGDTPLHWTFLDDHALGADIARALLDAGAAPNARGSIHATPLHYAAKRGDWRAVEALIGAGADPGAADEDGDTPLYWAASNGHVQTARSLVAATQAASAVPVAEATAMDVAARNGGLKILDVLLAAGLDPRLSSFSFPDARGRLFTNRDIEGKVVLLNLWATWCGPCRSEMPWFVEFQNRYRDRGFTVAAVSMDEDGWDVVRPFVEELGLNFPVLLGGDDTEVSFGAVDAIPVTLIIDREGRIAFWHEGVPEKAEYERQIESLL